MTNDPTYNTEFIFTIGELIRVLIIDGDNAIVIILFIDFLNEGLSVEVDSINCSVIIKASLIDKGNLTIRVSWHH